MNEKLASDLLVLKRGPTQLLRLRLALIVCKPGKEERATGVFLSSCPEKVCLPAAFYTCEATGRMSNGMWTVLDQGTT